MPGDLDEQPDKLPLLPKRKKFLIPIIILLSLTLIGTFVGLWIGFVSIKRSDAFKATTAELEASPIVRQQVGLPFEPGLLVIGKHDDYNGTYDLSFEIEGPAGSAAIRSRCERDNDNDPWQVTFLDIGVGGREGTVYTLIGDPKKPPNSN